MPSSRSPVRVMILIAQLGRGGAERQVYQLASRLDRRRFAPMVVTFEPDEEYRGWLERAGIEVIVIRKTAATEILVLRRLAALMRQKRIDIVHAYLFSAGWRAVLASRLSRVRPVLYAVRSTSTRMSLRLRLMHRLTLRGADRVIANAPSVRTDIVEQAGLPLDEIALILNGVDTTVFAPGPSALRNEWMRGAMPDASLVGFVGGFRRAKDPCLFVRIAAAVARLRPATRFVMVGDGELRGEVEDAIRETGMQERIILAGLRSDVPEVFRALDLLVVTSYREGCCNAILEAMATGVPVVATAVGGNPDIVGHETSGLLFPYGGVTEGADAVSALLSGDGRAKRYGAEGLRRARSSFSIDAMVAETARLYEDLA